MIVLQGRNLFERTTFTKGGKKKKQQESEVTGFTVLFYDEETIKPQSFFYFH